jgi:hypothetical protein
MDRRETETARMRSEPMTCPYLEEVVMLLCRAYPVKKPLPRDRVVASPCLGDGFSRCPFFQERLPADEKPAPNERARTRTATT